jgi:hypothetical protein
MNLSFPTCLALFLTVILGIGCATPRYVYPDPGVRVGNLRDTVTRLCAIQPPRHAGNPRSLAVAADQITRQFRRNGLEPVSRSFVVDGNPYCNVIARTGPPTGPLVIVGAHYDVCGDQPGADDNASAVAGLLEIARFAKQHEAALPYGVEFVAYALEEPPHFGTRQMGSYIHAESLHQRRVPVRGMLCLDMIGYFSEVPGSQRYPLPGLGLLFPSRGNFIAVVSNFGSRSLSSQVATHLKATAIGVEVVRAPAFLTGVDFSDHRNYWAFGHEAVMLTDTAFYRNPNYHQPADRPETLAFEQMAEVVKGVCWTLLNLR